MRFPLVIGAAALALSAGFAFAQDVTQREVQMKEVGGAFGQLNRMNRGQDPYDPAKAKAAFERIAAAGTAFAPLFGAEPTAVGAALPSIWENKADFDQRLQKLISDAKAGAATSDEAGFKTAFTTLQPSCGVCHKVYRGD